VLSNGVVVEMPDNSLFMAYWTSEYIRSMTSSNGGQTWDNDAEFINTPGNTRDFPGGFLVDGSKVWFFFSKIPAADSTDFTDGEIYSIENGSNWSQGGEMDLTGSDHGLTEGTILETANHDLVCYMRDETTPGGGTFTSRYLPMMV